MKRNAKWQESEREYTALVEGMTDEKYFLCFIIDC